MGWERRRKNILTAENEPTMEKRGPEISKLWSRNPCRCTRKISSANPSEFEFRGIPYLFDAESLRAQARGN